MLRNLGTGGSSQDVKGKGSDEYSHHPKCCFFSLKYDLYERERLPIIFAGQHQVCNKLMCSLCADIPSGMVDDSSCVMTAGPSLAAFPPQCEPICLVDIDVGSA